MLAQHRLRDDLGIINPGLELFFAIGLEGIEEIAPGRRSGIVPVDAQPVHFTATPDLVLANDRNVVFALAGDHARRAADAQVQINRHAPLVKPLFLHFIKRIIVERFHHWRLLELHELGEIWMLSVLIQIRLAHNRPPFHRPMVLRNRKGIFLIRLVERRSHCEIFRVARAQWISIKPGATTDAARHIAPITQGQAK